MKPVDIQQWVDQYVRSVAPIFFIKIDADDIIQDTNEFTSKLVGKPLIGVHYKEIILDFSGTINFKQLSENPLKTHIINVVTFSGLPQTLLSTFTALNDGYVVLGHVDVEEMESLQKKVLELNNNLGKLNRELHKKNVELKKLNRLKNQFLSYATHDLRKPVSVILTYAEFLEEDTDDVLSLEHKAFLKKIKASGIFMKNLINDFLDISMIESGMFKLDRQKLKLKSLLDSAFWRLELKAKKKDININITHDEKLPEMYLDASKCEQVFLNIIGNAIEHSYPESCINVKTIKSGNEVTVLVRDFGVGMSAQQQKNLFNPNKRIRTTKTGGEKSTGMGLLISKKIIEAHGGRIELSSNSGKGTCFKLVLPITQK